MNGRLRRTIALAMLAGPLVVSTSGCFTYWAKRDVLDRTRWHAFEVESFDGVAACGTGAGSPPNVCARVRYDDGQLWDRSCDNHAVCVAANASATAAVPFKAAPGPIVFVDGSPGTAQLRIGRPIQHVDARGQLERELVPLTAAEAERATLVLAERTKGGWSGVTFRASFPPDDGRALVDDGLAADLSRDVSVVAQASRGESVDTGSPLEFLAWLPLTLAGDVVTSPLQGLALTIVVGALVYIQLNRWFHGW